MQIRFEFMLSKDTYGSLPILKISVEEVVPPNRQDDPVSYLRERINSEFRRVTGTTAIMTDTTPTEDGSEHF